MNDLTLMMLHFSLATNDIRYKRSMGEYRWGNRAKLNYGITLVFGDFILVSILLLVYKY